MAIPTIHVGCTHFARGRLQALVNCEGLYPVACVDINLDEAQEGVGSLDGDVPEGLDDRIYTTITEARAETSCGGVPHLRFDAGARKAGRRKSESWAAYVVCQTDCDNAGGVSGNYQGSQGTSRSDAGAGTK